MELMESNLKIHHQNTFLVQPLFHLSYFQCVRPLDSCLPQDFLQGK